MQCIQLGAQGPSVSLSLFSFSFLFFPLTIKGCSEWPLISLASESPDWIQSGYSILLGGGGHFPMGPAMLVLIHTLPVVERCLTMGLVVLPFFMGFHSFSYG